MLTGKDQYQRCLCAHSIAIHGKESTTEKRTRKPRRCTLPQTGECPPSEGGTVHFLDTREPTVSSDNHDRKTSRFTRSCVCCSHPWYADSSTSRFSLKSLGVLTGQTMFPKFRFRERHPSIREVPRELSRSLGLGHLDLSYLA